MLAPKLGAEAWLYVESPHAADAAPPGDWTLHREGHTRDVRYALYRRTRAAGDAGGAGTLAASPAGAAAT